MQSPIRKIFSDSVVYGFGIIINRFLGFLLLPIHTYFFSPGQYGVYSLIYSFGFFAVVFYLFGMETSFQKYFLETKEHDGREKIFSTTMLLLSVTSFFFSLVIFIFSDFIAGMLTGNRDNGFLVKILSVLLFIDVLSRFPMILINSLQLSKVYTLLNVGAVIVNIVSNIVLIIIMKMGIEAIFYSLIFSYVFILIVSLVYCREYLILNIDKTRIKKLVKFAHSFLYYGIFLIILDQADKFIIQYFGGSEKVGIYSACYRIGMIMNLMTAGFRTAWIPFFMNLKDEENNKEIFSKVFTYYFFGGMLFFLVIALFGTDIVEFKINGFSLLDEKYWSGMVILPFILLSYFLFGLYANVNIASYFENKIKYLIVSSGAGAAVNIVLNMILIPKFSIIGAAASTMISYLIMFISLYFFSQKIYRINYEWKRISGVVIITFCLYFFNIIIKDYFTAHNFDIKIVYLIKIFSSFLLIFVLFRQNFFKFRQKSTF